MGGSQSVTTGTKYSDLSFTSSTFGTPIGIVYGTHKLSGNLIDYVDFTRTEEEESSGKGGSASSTSYDYHVAVDIGLCEGSSVGIAGIGRIWDSSTPYKKHAINSSYGLDSATIEAMKALYYDSDGNSLDDEDTLSVFYGSKSQAAWSYMTSNHSAHALAYPYTAHAAGYIDLGSDNSLPTYAFEVYGLNIYGSGNLDCEPYLIIKGLLFNTIHGINYGINASSNYLYDMTNYQNYCLAEGIFLSLVLESSQSSAADVLNDILMATNSQAVMTQGLLKFVPYGTTTITGNGATYTPDLDAVFSLTDDDYINNEEPVKENEDDTSDIFNFQQLTFKNRADEYADDVISFQDSASIKDLGIKKADSLSLDCITTATVAGIVIGIVGERTIYHRKTYTIDLPYFPYILFDPMDLLEVTENYLGIDAELMRINKIDIDEEYKITITVEEVGVTGSGTVVYSGETAVRASSNSAVSPGDVNEPVIFEPPSELGDGLEIWIGASGKTSNWGGCFVYVSDDETNYKLYGEISKGARQGVLSSALASGSDPDKTNSFSVNLAESRSTITGGSQSDADSYNTLALVGSELISYEAATLGDEEYNYTIGTYLRRGVYGTTIAAHTLNEKFLRIDSSRFFQYGFGEADIGKTLYFKFVSYNIYNAGLQSLADVDPYIYTIKGSAEYSDLDPITNLKMVYQDKKAKLTWDAVSDFRSPIYYEIRFGSAWESSLIMGRVCSPSYTVPTKGTYWIKAVYTYVYDGTTYTAYSSSAESIDVEIASIAANVIATYDEYSTGWLGTCSGYAKVNSSGYVWLTGGGLVSDITKFSEVMSLYWYGGVGGQGIYTIPESHIISVSSCEYVNVICTYACKVVAATSKFSEVQKVSEMESFSMEESGNGYCTVQINVEGSDGTWSGWQDYEAGHYYGKGFNFRLVINSSNTQYTVVVTDFSISVDVDDKNDYGNITVETAGTSVTYSTQFNMVPTPVISIVDEQSGDMVTLTNETSTGFTIAITNNGTAVSRSVNWTAVGY